jgi:hypothetical protein
MKSIVVVAVLCTALLLDKVGWEAAIVLGLSIAGGAWLLVHLVRDEAAAVVVATLSVISCIDHPLIQIATAVVVAALFKLNKMKGSGQKEIDRKVEEIARKMWSGSEHNDRYFGTKD